MSPNMLWYKADRSTKCPGYARLLNLCHAQALQSIAEFKGLQRLVLADCSAVTTGGLEQLSGLVGLQHLALLRCPRVGDKGMTLLHCLTCLTYLALTGCSKVTTHAPNACCHAFLIAADSVLS